MPKFPKGFGRRKSAANVFDDVQDAPHSSESSFKVFERPAERSDKSFDGGIKLKKATMDQLSTSRSNAPNREDNMFEGIIQNRGSGASNTNTASTTDNSSRFSAASTAPSSTDAPRTDDRKDSHDKPFSAFPVPPIPKSQPPLSLKQRSLSWGRNNFKISTATAPPPPTKDLPLPPPPPVEKETQNRPRAFTASSYASTAKPPTLEDSNLGLSLGGDFSDMFSGFGKRKSAILKEQDLQKVPLNDSENESSGSYARKGFFNQPAPLNIDRNADIEPSPYSWHSQDSHDRLMSNTSPPLFAPRDDTPPPVPQHGQGSLTNDNGIRRTNGYARKPVGGNQGDDEDAKLLRESADALRRLNVPENAKVRDSWALPSSTDVTNADGAAVAEFMKGSAESTPKARKPLPERRTPSAQPSQDSLFDDQLALSVDAAMRFESRSTSPPTRTIPKNRVMTKAQFERYKQDQENLKSVGAKSKDDEEDDGNYDEEEDEAEKHKHLAKQRRKQEAHMAVYRQQMMKVTGEANPAPALRPGLQSSQSTPNMASLGVAEDGEEEDEEVPLAILQAHGFPNKNKPQLRSMGSSSSLRTSLAGGGGSGGALPVFARKLPQDPYFGAGLVHPPNRESLSLGGGAGSVVGGSQPRGLPPGGLVGVIATEERSRAMRRGSPNAQGEYPAAPPNGFDVMGNPIMNGMGPMGPMGMNSAMFNPADPAQMAMSQQLQQFMQMQMQFMQMMTQGGQAPPNMPPLPPQQGYRPSSAGGAPQISLRPGSSHSRAMTMLDPNMGSFMRGSQFGPAGSQNGYAPSIAPSERSNVGLSARYRPVSQVPPPADSSRMSTVSGSLQGWENKNQQPTIKAVKKTAADDEEDEEEGWEEMKKKREKKKSMWRSKRDTAGLKEMLNFQ